MFPDGLFDACLVASDVEFVDVGPPLEIREEVISVGRDGVMSPVVGAWVDRQLVLQQRAVEVMAGLQGVEVLDGLPGWVLEPWVLWLGFPWSFRLGEAIAAAEGWG